MITRTSLTCVAFIILGNFQNWNMWSLAVPTNPVCSSIECRALAYYYKQNMNPNGRPCNDFYDYVCKGWPAQNPRPPDAEMWSIDQAMDERVKMSLKLILGNATPSNVSEFETAKNLYKACQSLPSMDKQDILGMKKLLAGIGNWPMFMPRNKAPESLAWSLIENYYIQATGQSAFLTYNLIAESDENKNFLIVLRNMVSPYGSIRLLLPWKQRQDRKQYRAFLYSLVKFMTPDTMLILKSGIEKDLDDVIDFRDKMRQILDDTEDDQPYVLTTIENFQSWYNGEAKSEESSKIIWLDKIRAMYKNFKDSNGMPINHVTQIKVQQGYFSKLAALLRTTRKEVILNHIHVYFLETHMIYTPEVEKLLFKLVSRVDEIEMMKHVERWKWCINNHNMQSTLRKMYIKDFFPEETRRAVQLMFDEGKDILMKQLNESNWLDQNTKRKSIAKLDFTSCQIGYPDWYNPQSDIPRRSCDIDPLTPTAYFTQFSNTLHASATYLQTPLYNPHAPYVVDYGATFSLIGHELYHAFGHKGLKYDILGQNQIWWSTDMYNQFLEQSQCFDDQYNQRRDKIVKKLSRTIIPRDDLPSTVDEDISDVMGLKLAYEGFKQKLQQEKNVCPTLPGFETSCERLFFIAFGNAFCAALTPNDKFAMILMDKHSLPQIRVNGAVANMKEFTQAFGCGDKDPLKFKKSCDIWKK